MSVCQGKMPVCQCIYANMFTTLVAIRAKKLKKPEERGWLKIKMRGNGLPIGIAAMEKGPYLSPICLKASQ